MKRAIELNPKEENKETLVQYYLILQANAIEMSNVQDAKHVEYLEKRVKELEEENGKINDQAAYMAAILKTFDICSQLDYQLVKYTFRKTIQDFFKLFKSGVWMEYLEEDPIALYGTEPELSESVKGENSVSILSREVFAKG